MDSIFQQSIPVDKVLVVDDGSTDKSVVIARKYGAEVIEIPENKGRGFARKTGMENANSQWVLCCDATNSLPANFIEDALHWLENANIAAVYGKIVDPTPQSATDRWRAKYLFKQNEQNQPAHESDALITWGTFVRKSAHDEVGGYNASLRHSEDHDLGKRLKKTGYKIINDPTLHIRPLLSNPAPKVIERFLRWNFGPNKELTAKDRFKFIIYGLKVMLKRDILEGDLGCSLITIRCLITAMYYKS